MKRIIPDHNPNTAINVSNEEKREIENYDIASGIMITIVNTPTARKKTDSYDFDFAINFMLQRIIQKKNVSLNNEICSMHCSFYIMFFPQMTYAMHTLNTHTNVMFYAK